MHPIRVFQACVVLAFFAAARAQRPAAPAVPSSQAPATNGDEVRRAFVAADGSGKGAIAAAAEQVHKGGAASRTRFMVTLRAIAAAAPKPAPAPAAEPAAPAAGAPSAPVAVAKPPEFAEAVQKLMAEVVTGSPEAAAAALAKLAEDREAGPAALAQLDQRGKLVFARCLTSFLGRKMGTNAIYAGQFDDLRPFHPEASEALLRWAQRPPKDVPSPEPFRTACLRALRDVLPVAEATDSVRKDLRTIADAAQRSRNEALFLTAVCALHQYGDPSAFDTIQAGVAKQAASDKEPEKVAALGMLAELHYQLRKYDVAASHYVELVGLLEKSASRPDTLPTTIYNAACSLALAGKTDEALQFLDKALAAAAKGRALSRAMVDEDHDLDSLRADPRFPKLLEQYFGPAGAVRK